MRKKRIRTRMFKISIKEETVKQLILKVKRIANELGSGEEHETDNGFLTHCPHCHQKGVLHIKFNQYKHEIEYRCDAGCHLKEVKNAVFSRVFFARPPSPGFGLTKMETIGGYSINPAIYLKMTGMGRI